MSKWHVVLFSKQMLRKWTHKIQGTVPTFKRKKNPPNFTTSESYKQTDKC